MPNRNAGPAGPGGREPQGITRRAQGSTQQPKPRMPHERDESSNAQAADEPSQQRMGQIARDDVERGVVDTSKGEQLDETYQKTRQTSTNPHRKFSP